MTRAGALPAPQAGPRARRPDRPVSRARLAALLLALLSALALLVALLPALVPDASAGWRLATAGPPRGDAVAPGVVRQTRSYGPAGEENTYDVYLPADEPVRPRPTVVFVHGGSWEIGDKVEYTDEAVEVAQRGWTAVSLNYRRTPTAPWPAPLYDVRRALGHLQADAAALGVDVDRTGALGDSVGAQLASLLGRPAPGLVPLRAVVAWSGVNDLPGLLQQRSSGGCTTPSCSVSGLARKALRDLMRCAPDACPDAWREASPAAGLTRGAATLSITSETELIDPRQVWALDGALSRARVPSRVRVLPGGIHGRGYQDAVWDDSLRFLAAALTPETAPAYPRPRVTVSLAASRTRARVGTPVRLTGSVGPRAAGSSVALQVRDARGAWRTWRGAALRATPQGTVFDAPWTPSRAGTVVWRALWRGGGGEGVSAPVTVRVSP